MKFYVLYSLAGEMVGVAQWNSEEVELVRGQYLRQGIVITEKTI